MSAETMLDVAVAKLKSERRELEAQVAASRAGQVSLLRALNALYELKGDLKKPIEDKPTRDALRLAEMELQGYYSTPDEGNDPREEELTGEEAEALGYDSSGCFLNPPFKVPKHFPVRWCDLTADEAHLLAITRWICWSRLPRPSTGT